MRFIISFLTLVFFTNISSLSAQKVCESSEETIEDLNSITKCTIDKTEKNTASGKRTKKLSVKISSSTRFLKKRTQNKKEVSGLNSINTSGVESTKSDSEITNSLSFKKDNNSLSRLKERLSKEQLKNAFQFEDIDQIPLFKSCENKNSIEDANCFEEKMMAHIQKHFRYPNEALINKVQGNVWVRFVIDEDGNITNLKTLGPKNGEALKKEAIRVISKLTPFKPAMNKGKKVLAKYGFPINFSLDH